MSDYRPIGMDNDHDELTAMQLKANQLTDKVQLVDSYILEPNFNDDYIFSLLKVPEEWLEWLKK